MSQQIKDAVAQIRAFLKGKGLKEYSEQDCLATVKLDTPITVAQFENDYNVIASNSSGIDMVTSVHFSYMRYDGAVILVPDVNNDNLNHINNDAIFDSLVADDPDAHEASIYKVWDSLSGNKTFHVNNC